MLIKWFYDNPDFTFYGHAICVDNKNIKWFVTSKGLWSLDDNESPTEVEHKELSKILILHNYPNPFNATTTLEYLIFKEGFTNLIIYNLSGQKVRELVAHHMTVGAHIVVWDGKYEKGNSVSSGI